MLKPALILGCFAALSLLAAPRLISTSPQATEMLFQLGKGADLIATSQFSDYPEEAKSIPRVGPVFGIGVERILSMNPDWVITDPEASSAAMERGLAATSIRHFPLKVNSLHALFEGSEELLRRLYGERKNSTLDQHRRCVSALDPKENFTFVAFTWLTPPILFGRGTFISDVIKSTGGENLVPRDIKTNFPRVSVEWILRQRPHVMYFLTETPQDTSEAHRLAEYWWPVNTPPVKALPAAHFARGSFTPLRHLEEIREGISPKECR